MNGAMLSGSDQGALLPAFVASARAPAERRPDSSVVLPATLSSATPKRQREFLAGRACAAAALAQLGLPNATVSIGPGGAPVWPAGVVGSITHTNGFAWAAAARVQHALGIGIDAEPLMADDRASRIASRLATAHELTSVAQQAGLDRAAALTLVFCAKEAFYKCLYPEIRRVFDYLDARVDTAEAHRARIAIRLSTTLSRGWLAGSRLDGRFEIKDGVVHVAFVR